MLSYNKIIVNFLINQEGMNMQKRVLGIDVGIASIGYALIEFDDSNLEETGRIGKIIKAGVRTFETAEIPKTGESLAKPRRDARLARRRNRRRAIRMYQIKELFVKYNLLFPEQLENLYKTENYKKDVWDLRKEALERSLTNEEFARILTHIAKRRGFKSLRKTEEAKTVGDLLKGIQRTKQEIEEGGFLTAGQMFATHYNDNEAKRNKSDSYKNSIQRELLEEEIKTIFAKQREFNNLHASQEFEEEYAKIAFYQRDIGSVLKMVGKCTFELDELRAPKQSYSGEIFTLLTKLVNLRLIDSEGKNAERFLTPEEIKTIYDLAHKQKELKYLTVRKELNLEENFQFKGSDYKKEDKNPESVKFFEMQGYHKIRKALEKLPQWEMIKTDTKILNKIAEAITFQKSDDAIKEALFNSGMQVEIVNALLEADISMAKVLHLSTKAIDKIIPYMLEGYKYNEACEKAGYNHSNPINNIEKRNFLPALTQEETTVNPVVNRAVSQFRKVVNAIIREYGTFDQINIEMARDLSNSHADRQKIKKAQEDFQSEKERAKQRCLENSINPYSGNNLLKFRLWEQQGGYCLYSGQYIEPQALSDIDYTDIDHIIPYSRCMDDSMNNKVLCLASENRQKGNKIPHEYISESRWEEFVARVNTANLKTAKKNRLLKLKYTNEDSKGFIERNINDTRYIARFLKDYVEKNLDFGVNDNKKHVQVRSGSLTAFLRHQWGLTKNRSESDKHHALDAIVTACATQGMVNYLSAVSAKREGKEWLKYQKPRFSELDEIFVSRMPRRKVTGQAHAETIRSAKYLEQGFSVLKTPLTKINLRVLGKPDEKAGLHDKQSNWRLYEVLKARLEEFNDDPQKAFGNQDNPVYMPLSEEKIKAGQKPHIIRSVKICTTQKSGLKVRNGIASNGDMVRIDLFAKIDKKGKKQYFVIPVYVADLINPILPDEVLPSGKKIDDSHEFQFSFYRNDLISINSSGKSNDEKLYYYNSFDIDSARIIVESIDRNALMDGNIKGKPHQKRYSILNLPNIKKYQVDILGNYTEVKKEKRVGNLKYKDVMANNTYNKTL